MEPDVTIVRKPTTLDRIRLASYACGHRDVRQFEFRAYGSEVILEDRYLLKRKRCGECELKRLREGAIRCCACGQHILPSAPVCLYVICADQPPFTVRVRSPNRHFAVGCLRTNCAECGLDWCGNWSPEGVRLPREIPAGQGITLEPDPQGELYPRMDTAS